LAWIITKYMHVSLDVFCIGVNTLNTLIVQSVGVLGTRKWVELKFQ
jgi:hypothetical protein